MNTRRIVNILSKEDIYEFVFKEDFDSVLPSGKPSLYQIKSNQYSLAREIGRLAYLDYIMIVTRTVARFKGVTLEIDMINVETAERFYVRKKIEKAKFQHPAFWRKTWKELYKELFEKGKLDLTITANRKGNEHIKRASLERSIFKPKDQPAGTIKNEAVLETEKKEDAPKSVERADMHQKIPEVEIFNSGAQHFDKQRSSLPEKIKKAALLVNDLKTINLSPVVGLILSEHLRSEILKTQRFRIINRENLKEALDEMGLQMTGIIEDSEAVKAGKGLGVKKMVSGSIGQVGDYYTVSLKFINIETLETEGMIFEKVKALSEEKLFNTINLVAQKLASSLK
ncbi:MAG: CsgG/HfaB family protein [Thermodesulfobacteriota bacterium]|nr:CsgG/HfaB family protein [Thermodesulfobacteriota bacterium]